MERVLPTHAWRWIRTGVIALPLRRYVKARSEQVAGMMEDLGGVDAITTMERAALDGWLQAQVVADVLFSRFLQTEDVKYVANVTQYLNTARSQLALIGVHRRASEVLNVTEYLSAKSAKKSSENAT